MIFSVRVNNDLPAAELIQLARASESVGFDQLWVSNDMFLRGAPALVGALTAHTSTLSLGIGVMNPYSMHVSELAMTAAALQELSNGRFLLGVGAGSVQFLSWAGLSRPSPLATTRQSIAVLRTMLGHLDAEPSDLPDWFSEQSALRFRLLAPVPVYLGGMGPKMLRLAGEVADGALPLLYPPEHFALAKAQVQEGRIAAGRETPFDLPACFWVSVSSDRAAGRAALAEKLAYYGPSISPALLAAVGLTPDDFAAAAIVAQRGGSAASLISDQMLTLGLAGDPSDVIQRCRGLIALGATHLSFGPPLGPDPVKAIQLLGEHVLPALRDNPQTRGNCRD